RAQSQEALRYEEVDFIGLGDYVASAGVPFWYYNVPLCQLGRHAARSHELGVLASDETYFDFDHRGRSEYYDSSAQLEGRVFPEVACKSCSVSPLCCGIEESYRLLAGAADLHARSDDPRPIVAAALSDRELDPALAEQ